MDLVLLRVLAVRARAGVAEEDGLILEKANVALHGAGNEFFRVDPRPLIPSLKVGVLPIPPNPLTPI